MCAERESGYNTDMNKTPNPKTVAVNRSKRLVREMLKPTYTSQSKDK